jgi:hypothetical protein
MENGPEHIPKQMIQLDAKDSNRFFLKVAEYQVIHRSIPYIPLPISGGGRAIEVGIAHHDYPKMMRDCLKMAHCTGCYRMLPAQFQWSSDSFPSKCSAYFGTLFLVGRMPIYTHLTSFDII